MTGYTGYNSFNLLPQDPEGDWNFNWGLNSEPAARPAYQIPGDFNMTAPENLKALGTGGTSGPPGIGALGWTQMGLYGMNTLGNLWGALQANKLAKNQLAFTKEIGNANLNNQIKSYNTTLEDRARSRAVMEGQTQDQAQAYIDANRLSR